MLSCQHIALDITGPYNPPLKSPGENSTPQESSRWSAILTTTFTCASLEPIETARYFEQMFGAKILETVQSDGQPRVDIDINGLIVFIARATSDTPAGPVDPHLGLDHFGLRVDDLEAAATDLKSKGAVFSTEPHQLRPGVKIAFVRAPGDVRIELLERSGSE